MSAEHPEPRHPAAPVPLLNIANLLTVFRIVLVPVFVILMILDAQDYGLWRWIALGVFLAAIYTDKLDGDIARQRGLITDFGKIADPIADKLLIGSALVLLSVLHELPWWITVVILVRELGITLLRFLVIRHGVIAASRGGKTKTVVQTVVIVAALLPITPLLLPLSIAVFIGFLIAVVVTVVTGADYVGQAFRMRKVPQ